VRIIPLPAWQPNKVIFIYVLQALNIVVKELLELLGLFGRTKFEFNLVEHVFTLLCFVGVESLRF
jgi:uncharacterized membrane protein